MSSLDRDAGRTPAKDACQTRRASLHSAGDRTVEKSRENGDEQTERHEAMKHGVARGAEKWSGEQDEEE